MNKQKKIPKFIKITKTDNPINWWKRYGLLGKTFEVLDISEYDFVKIKYDEDSYGWIPLIYCEVNPHLRLIVNNKRRK